MTLQTSHDQAIQLLQDAGFDSGWVVADGKLVLWEHKENPPEPFVKPNEVPTSGI
jgi:hypothetical protein